MQSAKQTPTLCSQQAKFITMRSQILDVSAKLQDLLNLSAENEIVEFKEAASSYDFNKLGKYFSALSNEANLKHQQNSWLVFGVSDRRQVVGSRYRLNRPDLDSLKKDIADKQ
jgi:ATP-dependent DNA helicase RecG